MAATTIPSPTPTVESHTGTAACQCHDRAADQPVDPLACTCHEDVVRRQAAEQQAVLPALEESPRVRLAPVAARPSARAVLVESPSKVTGGSSAWALAVLAVLGGAALVMFLPALTGALLLLAIGLSPVLLWVLGVLATSAVRPSGATEQVAHAPVVGHAPRVPTA